MECIALLSLVFFHYQSSFKNPSNRYFLKNDFPDVFVDNLWIVLMRAMSSSVDNLHGKPDRETEVTSQLT